MTDSLSALVAGVVDYAGLFPPAKLDMAPAVQEYAAYLNDPNRAMLGRFVVPVARLGEFDRATSGILPHETGAAPWRLSVLSGPDVSADITLSLAFNERHAAGESLGHAIIDSIEIKAESTAEIESAMSMMPRGIRAYFEIPIVADPAELIRALKRSGGLAKVRTGGITSDAFPESVLIARFLERCREHAVPFKATAGLHHPIRAEYRLTYDPNPPVGMMYGYLNVFVAAVLAWIGASEMSIQDALDEPNAAAFVFTNTELTYQGHVIPVSTIHDVRNSFAMSFGSCSFREPVDDLVVLGLH